MSYTKVVSARSYREPQLNFVTWSDGKTNFTIAKTNFFAINYKEPNGIVYELITNTIDELYEAVKEVGDQFLLDFFIDQINKWKTTNIDEVRKMIFEDQTILGENKNTCFNIISTVWSFKIPDSN